MKVFFKKHIYYILLIKPVEMENAKFFECKY